MIGAFSTVTKGQLKGLGDWKVGDNWRLSKQRHCSERPEYWEESWRLKETCCHSNSSKRPSDMKNSQIVNNNNNNNRDDRGCI